MGMFIRRTIRLIFIAVSPREHDSLTLLILRPLLLRRARVVPKRGYLRDPPRLSKSQTVETDIFSRGVTFIPAHVEARFGLPL